MMRMKPNLTKKLLIIANRNKSTVHEKKNLFPVDGLGELGYGHEKCYLKKNMHHVFKKKKIKQSHFDWAVITFSFSLCM